MTTERAWNPIQGSHPKLNLIADLDAWIEKLRAKTPLEEDELELLCRIVKDILMQEPNVIVFSPRSS